MALVPVHRGRADRTAEVVAHAIVDDADLDRIARYYWTLDKRGYATRAVAQPLHHDQILMHHDVLGSRPGAGFVTDHINRNRLDNRRANLRVVTRAANSQNRDGDANTTSRYRGVSWRSDIGRWRAYGGVNGLRHHIGHFDTEDEAAAAASAWRRENMPYSFEDVAA